METSLDPTALLINVNQDLGPHPTPPNILDLVPPAFSPKERPIITQTIRQSGVKDTDNLPPKYISSIEDYISFQDRKAEFTRYKRNEFEEARNETNPYERIGRSIFMNRAGLKIANIDALYKITYHLGAFMHLTTPGPFKFCSLADAPGGFTQYIQWRRDEAMGYGISLKGKDSSTISQEPPIFDWDMKQLDNHRFFPYYGKSDTGNLYIEWRNFVDRVRRDQVMGIDLVTGDGGFDIETERAFAKQEFLSFRLIMVQLLTALKLLKPGGNFVMKLFDTVTELSAQLLYIASLCFDKISLIKPITSRPANAEKYFIGQGKRKNTDQYELILEQTNRSYNEDENVIQMLSGDLPEDFTKWLLEMNDLFLENQREAVEWIFDYLEGRNPKIPQVDLHKALILFNVPGNPIVKRSQIKIPGSGRGIPFSTSKGYP